MKAERVILKYREGGKSRYKPIPISEPLHFGKLEPTGLQIGDEFYRIIARGIDTLVVER
jgi:hypothetical protein